MPGESSFFGGKNTMNATTNEKITIKPPKMSKPITIKGAPGRRPKVAIYNFNVYHESEPIVVTPVPVVPEDSKSSSFFKTSWNNFL